MDKAIKIILACALCLAVVYAGVRLVRMLLLS